jgi:hypothetical protein
MSHPCRISAAPFPTIRIEEDRASNSLIRAKKRGSYEHDLCSADPPNKHHTDKREPFWRYPGILGVAEDGLRKITAGSVAPESIARIVRLGNAPKLPRRFPAS